MKLGRPLLIAGLAIGSILPALGIGRSGDGTPLASPSRPIDNAVALNWAVPPGYFSRDSMQMPDTSYHDSTMRDTSRGDSGVRDTLRRPPPRHPRRPSDPPGETRR